MARLEWYDAIYRFQARWIDNRGSELPIKARYSAWVIGIVASAIFFGFVRAAGVDVLLGAFYSVGLGAGTAYLGANYLTSEHTPTSWAQIGVYGTRRAVRRHRRMRRTRRQLRPRRVVGCGPRHTLPAPIARHVCKVLPVAGYAPPARKARP